MKIISKSDTPNNTLLLVRAESFVAGSGEVRCFMEEISFGLRDKGNGMRMTLVLISLLYKVGDMAWLAIISVS